VQRTIWREIMIHKELKITEDETNQVNIIYQEAKCHQETHSQGWLHCCCSHMEWGNGDNTTLIQLMHRLNVTVIREWNTQTTTHKPDTASSNITIIISINDNNQTGVSFTNDIILQIHTFILKSPTTKMIPTLTHFGTTRDTKYWMTFNLKNHKWLWND
jgi:hypothetical protein